MKTFKKTQALVLQWLLNRKSVDDTTNRGGWMTIGIIAVLIVAALAFPQVKEIFTSILNMWRGATDGSVTTPPGGWNS